ncbi:penicillin-binding protein 1A [Candidatus Deianiraea vastatrix]|nr:transglycosylase domain-containing protein [Candidatus Deianiraea vastatrix]
MIFVVGSIVAISISFYAYILWKQEIDISAMKNYRPIMSSKIVDINGKLVGEFANERRIFISIDKIPKHLINAFISAEDRNFYTHQGIDLQGLFRACITSPIYFLSGRKIHGASTITQQVVRNTILSKERTLTRKLKEMILSYRISKIMSKEEIMEIYLNQIYLGSKSYGVEAASNEYFGKSVQDITISESALIASLAKAPSTLDPRKGKAATLNRRNWIIKSMFEEQYITKEEMNESLEQPINLKNKTFTRKPYSYIEYVTYYLENEKQILRENLEQDGYLIKTKFDYQIYDMAYKALNNGIKNYDKRHGYKGPIGKCEDVRKIQKCLDSFNTPDLLGENKIAVITNISNDCVEIEMTKNEKSKIAFNDLKWARKRLENLQLGQEIKTPSDIFEIGDIIVVEKNGDKYTLDQIPEINGAVTIINPQTAEIIAMVGGYLDIPGSFNRAFQAKRQPGSVAKPFSYLAALESGFKLNNIIIDSDVQIATGGGGAWMPVNNTKDHSGAITLRRAFEKSLNSPLARVMNDVGASKLPPLLARLGITDNAEPNLSTALGTFDTTLVNILTGYSIIINGGIKAKHCPIVSIEKIGDAEKFENTTKENEIPKDETEKTKNTDNIEDIMDDLSNKIFASNEEREVGDQIIDPRLAYQITSLLQGSATRGTAAKFGALAPGLLLGKTGTTNDAKDLWFIGGSTDYLIGVYIGYDIPKSLGVNEYGAVTALPIANEIMSQIVKIYPPKAPIAPEGLKFIDIDIETGKIPSRKNAKTIKEVFLIEDTINNEETNNDTQDSQAQADITGIY